MVSITPADVRSAGSLDDEDYPDSELQFEIDFAVGIVNDELEPYAQDSDTAALERTAALLAAAFAKDGKVVTQLSQGNRSLSFSADESLTFFDMAKVADPTDERLAAVLDVESVKGTFRVL